MRRLRRLVPRRVRAVDAPTTGAPGARLRAERRAVARQLHPDRGGDVEAYLAALAEVDRRYGVGSRDPAGPTRRRRRRSGLRRRLNRAARAARQRLPRGTPGARRYAGL